MAMAEPNEPKVRTLNLIAQDLQKEFAGNALAEEAALALNKAASLMLPVFMGLSQAAMADNAAPDEAMIFTFMGSGASDMSSVAQFRELMGDEREALEEYETACKQEGEAARRGECTNMFGCQNADHRGSCGYSYSEPVAAEDFLIADGILVEGKTDEPSS